MELRRALLLFAVVLGLAAIVASASRPPSGDGSSTVPSDATTPAARPSAGPGPPQEIAFEADLRSETKTVGTGVAATVTVTSYDPGLVEIEKLGLTAPTEPGGPARFDLLTESPQTYDVTFTPVETGRPRKIGVIEVEPGR